MPSMTDSPLTRLSPEELDALGRELDAIHDEVFEDLGDRDRRYITSMVEMHRRLVVLGRILLDRLAPQAGVDRRDHRCSRWARSWRTWRSATT